MINPPQYRLYTGSHYRGWGVTWVRSLWNRTLGAWLGEPR